MKKILVFIICFLISIPLTNAAEKVDLYLFYGKTCRFCINEKEFLASLEQKYNLNLHYYEVWYNEDNQKLYQKTISYFNKNINTVPLTILGNEYFSGYNLEIKTQIEDKIAALSKQPERSIMEDLLAGKPVKSKEEQKKEAMYQALLKSNIWQIASLKFTPFLWKDFCPLWEIPI